MHPEVLTVRKKYNPVCDCKSISFIGEWKNLLAYHMIIININASDEAYSLDK